MRIVYRIEDDNGCGPYSTLQPFKDGRYYTREDILEEYLYGEKYPQPEDDGIVYTGKEDRFGFKDLQQLYQWFDKEVRAKLSQYGFRIVKYEVDKIAEGNKQVMFNINDVKRKVG